MTQQTAPEGHLLLEFQAKDIANNDMILSFALFGGCVEVRRRVDLNDLARRERVLGSADQNELSDWLAAPQGQFIMQEVILEPYYEHVMFYVDGLNPWYLDPGEEKRLVGALQSRQARRQAAVSPSPLSLASGPHIRPWWTERRVDLRRPPPVHHGPRLRE
jgi:hypothetical protein